MNRLSILILFCVSIVLTPAHAIAEEQWGTFKGQFLYPKNVPQPELLTITKDQAVCEKPKLRDESLLVDEKTKGLANVVLWLSSADAPVHPDLADTSKLKPAVLSNKDCRFSPHILLMRTGQQLSIENDDPVAHSTAIFFFRNDPINISTGPNATVTKETNKAESLPAKVSCPIHSWMLSYVLVKDTPYMAVTDSQGRFEIPKLPAGTWTFQIWHESAGYLSVIESDADGDVELEKGGTLTVIVKPNQTTSDRYTVFVEDFD